MFGFDSYDEDVQDLKKVSSKEAHQLLSNEDLAIVYIGRSTCPFCRKFVKTLNGLVDKINAPIYYVESDNVSDTDITTFRDHYDVVTVPGFIVSKNKEITTICDSSTPESSLLDLIK